MDLYGIISYAVFVYLFMRHLVISVLVSLDQELSENVWFVWSKPSYSGGVTEAGWDGRTDNEGKVELLSF